MVLINESFMSTLMFVLFTKDQANDRESGWLSQSVKRLPLDFGSGHDLTVCEFGPASHSVLTDRSLEPTSDSVSFCLPLPCSHSASLRNK